MAQIVKLRRSSVPGQKPTNSNLQLGELALNTYDGKVFFAKSGSLGPTVEELISTNTVNTGSIYITGDITGSLFTGSFKGDGSQLYNIPFSGVTDLVTVSGSLDSRLDVLEAYSSSQLVPSSSMSFRTLQTDVYCKNSTGTQINKGTVVRIVGAVGDNPLIGIADPTTEHNSANTLGIATQDIPNDDFGLVITEGVLVGVNTNGMTAGALLYLGANGTFTTTPSVAPNHGVRLGEVLRVQQNNGSIYVRIDNGIELNEAHDVIYTGITHGDLLVRSGSVWKNGKELEGNYSVTGSLTITQNLTVLGSSSLVYVTSSQLAVSASFISVNVFEPAERFGGLKVYDSGSSNATASLAWDSQHNHWVYQNVSGSQYSGGMLLSGPRNSGSLGDEPGLIDGRIVKSVGGDHLDVSIISETGTTINIDGNLVANSITGSFDFFGLVNRPTLVSGSEQIDITGTTNYTSFSSSIATTDLNQENRLDSIEGVTGSYATTGSNTFYGDQTVSGTLNLHGPISSSTIHVVSGNNPQIQLKNETFGSEYHFGIGNANKLNIHDAASNQGIALFSTSSVYFNTNLEVSGSVSSSNFTGSFKGDGNGLYNIPATSVVGLELDRIVSGDSVAYINPNFFYVNRDVIVEGTITAKEIHTDYVTSSVLFQSGSTKFGDTNDDTHQFTGSVNITGSLYLNGVVVGTGKLDETTFESYTSSLDTRITTIEDTYLLTSSFETFTGSYNTGSFTGSFSGQFTGDASGNLKYVGVWNGTTYGYYLVNDVVKYENSLYVCNNNVFGNATPDLDGSFTLLSDTTPTGSFLVTSSFESFTGSYTTGSFTGSFIGDGSGLYNIPYTGITDIPNDIISGSLQIIDLGFTTTSSFNSFTSSYVNDSSSFDSRILEISGSIGGGSGAVNDGAFVSLIQSTPSATWTFNHALGQKYPIFQVFDVNDRVIIPSQITAVNSSTATITFPSAQAGRVIASLGTGPGGMTQYFNSAATWSLQHNMGTEYPIVTVYDTNKSIVIPNQIKSINENRIDVYFSTPIAGNLNVAKGGHIISGSVNVSSLDTNGSGFVSSSVQVTNFGFATTGSNRFNGNQTITGSVTLRNAKMDATCSVISSNTTIFNLSTFDGANFDYVVKNGSNMRAGNIMSVWDGSNSKYTETSTMDLGDTSNITFNVSGTGQLNAVVASGTWTVEVLYRALGCS
jgi:hypothetical protein